MKRTYDIMCPSCLGLGWVQNPEVVCTVTTIICPACHGSKVVGVVEIHPNDKECKDEDTCTNPSCDSCVRNRRKKCGN